MARLTWDELDKVKKKYNVSILWSWSRINSYMTSPYEYFLKYVLHKKEDMTNCAYAPIGSLAHSCLERYYSDEINHDTMLEEFEDGWLTNIDIADLKFDRNDDLKNESIKKKYKYDIEHFLKHHKRIANKVIVEKFVAAKINSNVLQGYIDAMYKDKDGNLCIIDFKTSSKFSAKAIEEKSGQLIVYAIALTQMGVSLDKIRIGFNMLKYCTVQYQQKNGAVKTRDIERYKVGESLQANAKMWLKDAGYSDEECNKYLKSLIDTNDISVLPDDARNKYKMSDCYVWVPLSQMLVNKWINTITSTITDIMKREKQYKDTGDESVFWDDEENVKKESFYFATLCGYSANLHKPYAQYLDSLEKSQNGANLFGGVGINTIQEPITTAVEINDTDLSWLDSIL